MTHGHIALRLMAQRHLNGRPVSDISPLAYLADVTIFCKITDDQPDSAFRYTYFLSNLSGSDPGIFCQQRQNRSMVCDKGPRLFIFLVITDFFTVTAGHVTFPFHLTGNPF